MTTLAQVKLDVDPKPIVFITGEFFFIEKNSCPYHKISLDTGDKIRKIFSLFCSQS